MIRKNILAIFTALAASVALVAPAAAQGTTSGPAVGGNVKPSATTQKQGGRDTKQSAQQPGGGSVSTGGVGVEAKQGSESGPAPSGKPAPK